MLLVDIPNLSPSEVETPKAFFSKKCDIFLIIAL